MSFEELLQALLAGGPRLITSLAQLLLEYCRHHASTLRADLANVELSALFSQHRHRMREFFDELGEEELEPADIAQLVASMRAFAEGTTEALSVRATVDALDDALGALILGAFRHKHVPLRQLGLVPYPQLPLRLVLGSDHLSTRPETVEPAIDRTSRFGLPPVDLAGVDVTMDWRLEDLLAPLKHDPGISIGDPGTSLAEMDLERYESDERALFYWVRPRAEAEQRRRVLQLVDLAHAQSCRVLVFPELSIDDATLEQIRKRTERPLVLIAGSRHTPGQARGPGENVSAFFVAHEERTHTKFRPFELKEPNIRRVEHLAPRNAAFTVFASQSWSFSVLVCKDFLSEEVQRLLVSLRVRLVLVPALSAETDDFRVGVEYLALHGQALSVVANETLAGSLFGRPIRRKLSEIARGELGRGALHVLRKQGILSMYLTDD